MYLKEPIPVLREIRPCSTENAHVLGLSAASNDYPPESNGFPSIAYGTAQVEVSLYTEKRPVHTGLFYFNDPVSPEFIGRGRATIRKSLLPLGLSSLFELPMTNQRFGLPLLRERRSSTDVWIARSFNAECA
jgi:hypothetical protein